MDDAPLRGDCARCASLCCVALAFDRSALFAFDKAAGEPCRHLGAKHRCAIHGRLAARGLAGCARYDCLGAGQIVVQQVFAGRSWRKYPELMRPMLDAFALMRQLQELRLLLREAGRLYLPGQQERLRKALLRALRPDEAWSPARLARFPIGRVRADVMDFLTGLRGNAGAPRQPPRSSRTPLPSRRRSRLRSVTPSA